MARSLFISPADVFANTLISGDTDHDKIVPHLEAAQDVDLFNLLGQNLYEHIDNLIADGVINEAANAAYKNLLDRYITPYLEQYAAARYLQYARYTVSEKGVFIHATTAGTSATRDEVEALVQDIRERGERYGNDMYEHICSNTVLYPEYITTNSEQVPPSHTPYDFGFDSF